MLPAAVAEHERALVPSAPEETRMALSRLAMSCRLEDMPDRAWEMHLSDFIEDLGDMPPDIVHDACRRWRRTNRFWPTISEFLELVGPELRKRRRDLDRLKVLAHVAENSAPGNDVDSDWYAKVTSRRADTPQIEARGGVRQIGAVLPPNIVKNGG